jgi:putative PIN family toxin of toxin-antitoxin system
MKVVIDTNVLVSAAWRDKSPEAVVIWIAFHEDWDWMVSQEILDEYRELLHRQKFKLSPEVIEKWETIVTNLTILVDVKIFVDFPRDQKDAKFLACALAADADYLITGDADFNEAQKLTKTTIISVSMFKRMMVDGKE